MNDVCDAGVLATLAVGGTRLIGPRCDTTLANITAFERGEPLVNAVGAELVKPSGG